jgi:hypothetical protein
LFALLLSVSSISEAQQSVDITGAVVDQLGAVIVGAPVDLAAIDGTPVQTATSDSQGAFAFSDVPPGSYVVTVNLPGFSPFATSAFTVTGLLATALPAIVLTVEDVSTSITVRPIGSIAEEQIQAQAQQRLFGLIPNFYVSYVPDAAPMTSRQKLTLALRETFDWTAFVGASVTAAIDQATNAHPAFGDGGSGYAKRWAAHFADDHTGDLLHHYVFASLFRQDPRYFYQGNGTKLSRLIHASTSPFVGRSDSGATMPNYAYLLGSLGAAGLSNAYYPHAARGGDLILTNVLIGLAGRAAVAVTQEFIGKHLTTNVPTAQ